MGYEILEIPLGSGGIRLVLRVEGADIATASAEGDIIHDMGVLLGLQRDTIVEDLRAALLDVLRTQGQSVHVDSIVEDPTSPLRFNGRYTHRLRNDLQTGIVWYDVSASLTGPDTVPAVVRNKMRFEVHRQLTGADGSARALVDLHK